MAVGLAVVEQVERELGADGAAFFVVGVGKVEFGGDRFDGQQVLGHRVSFEILSFDLKGYWVAGGFGDEQGTYPLPLTEVLKSSNQVG